MVMFTRDAISRMQAMGLRAVLSGLPFFKAISEGEQDIQMIAVIADGDKPVPPCGICRQVMIELAPQALAVMSNLEGKRERRTVQELLPSAFEKSSLK